MKVSTTLLGNYTSPTDRRIGKKCLILNSKLFNVTIHNRPLAVHYIEFGYLVFASWAAEEYGLEGSTEYVLENINHLMNR